MDNTYPRIMLRTREIATLRGFITTNDIRAAAKIGWSTANEYADDTVARVSRDTLERICQALSCYSLADLIYIYEGDALPPALHLGRPMHGAVTLESHIKARAQAQGFKTASQLAAAAGIARATALPLWRGDWEYLDRKSTLPRIYKALKCTSITDLITLRRDFDEIAEHHHAEQSMAAA